MAKKKVLDITPKGKNVIITGGYGHLGKAISASLAFYGAKVFIAGKSKEKFLKVFSNQEFKDNIHFIDCDISSSESIIRALKQIKSYNGRIDGLINNAIFSKGQSPFEMSREDFNYTLDGVLTTSYEMIKFAIPILAKGSSIINVSSMYGLVAPDFGAYKKNPEYLNPPHYGTAKAGIIQLTKYYASLLGEKNIRVNTVSPGPFPKYSIQKNIDFTNELKNRTLLNRVGFPEDLAGIFTFLMSDSSSFITGQNFIVDGGWTTR